MIKLVTGLACTATLLTACASTSGTGIGSSPHASAPTSQASRPAGASATPITKWYETVRPHVEKLEQSITYAQRVVRRPDHRGLASACRSIRTNVTTVRVAPKSPSIVVRHALGREIDAFDAAAVQCLSADYQQAGHSVDVAHRWAEVGNKRLRTLLDLPPKTGALL